MAEIPHEQYGSSLFIRNDAVCESFSTHTSGNIEIIQAQMNGLTVTSLYKPPNEEYSFGRTLSATPLNVVIGDFNSHSVNWGYRITDRNGTKVEEWSEANQLSLVHDAKQGKSFYSKRWQQSYNPDLAFVSTSIAHQCEKAVMEAIPKTQHRPISISLKAVVTPRRVPSRRRYNLQKADWIVYAVIKMRVL